MCFKFFIINEVDYRKGFFYMKNIYLIGYFLLIVILFFSLLLFILILFYVLKMLFLFGMYDGMFDYFLEKGIRFVLFVVFVFLYFMVLFVLKLIVNIVIELLLLFFVNDLEGNNLKKIRMGFMIYLGGGILFFVFL